MQHGVAWYVYPLSAVRSNGTFGLSSDGVWMWWWWCFVVRAIGFDQVVVSVECCLLVQNVAMYPVVALLAIGQLTEIERDALEDQD